MLTFILPSNDEKEKRSVCAYSNCRSILLEHIGHVVRMSASGYRGLRL